MIPLFRKPLFWIVALPTAFTIGIVAWFVYAHFEIEEREIPIPPSGEALRNPLLAAERFSREMGLPAESARSVDPLPPPTHALVYGVPSRILSRPRIDRLLQWVERGGFLVVSPYLEFGEPTEETANDPLLGEIEAWVDLIDDERGRTVFDVILEEDGETFEVQWLDAVGLYPLEGADPQFWIRRERGRGTIVMLNDLEFARNTRIGELDHAAFLWSLLASAGPREGVLFVYREERPSLLALLAGRAPVALAAGLLLLGLWVARVATRFGPVVPPRPPARRALMEHVEAVGRFLWRVGRQEALLETVRHDVERRIAARRPALTRGSPGERVSGIAKAFGLEPVVVRRALFDACPDGRRGWIETMRSLQKVRSRI